MYDHFDTKSFGVFDNVPAFSVAYMKRYVLAYRSKPQIGDAVVSFVAVYVVNCHAFWRMLAVHP